MSDLAPFVAAALRDRTVADLLEEVQTLRAGLTQLKRVEITSPGREIVYARGQFDDDGEEQGNPNLWKVRLHQVAPCPLSDLAAAEFRLGGTRLFKMEAEDVQIYEDGFHTDEDGQDIFELSLCAVVPFVSWVSLQIKGRSESQWEPIRESWYENEEVITADLLSRTSTDTIMVSFPDIALGKGNVPDLMEMVPASKKMSDEEQQHTHAFRNYYGSILGLMRDGGNQERPAEFQLDGDQMMDALMYHGIDNSDDERLFDVVRPFIALQMFLKEQGRQDEFLDITQTGTLPEILETINRMGVVVEQPDDEDSDGRMSEEED
jgi:hypothetical protein